MKKTVQDIEVEGKRILVRADYNVPLSEDGEVLNDKRIRATLPTLTYLLERGARVIIMTHLGRPKGEVVENLRTNPVAEKLSEVIGHPVKKLDDCIGEEVEKAVSEMKNGDVIMLENVRFYSEEKENDPEFAEKLSRLGDVYMNDGFGVSHREHASITGVAAHLQSVSGFLVQDELRVLTKVRDNPEEPLVVIMGGVKLETRIPMIEQFVEKADKILFGGAMIFTFFKAQGKEVGNSLVDEAFVETAKELLEKYPDKLVLPVDIDAAEEFAENAEFKTVPVDEIPEGTMGLDVGPETVKLFTEVCKNAKTVVWNGPLGAFETKPFNEATEEFARNLAELDAYTVIGGGDTSAALEVAGIANRMRFVSTGGGASLTLLEGKKLPGIEVLEDK